MDKSVEQLNSQLDSVLKPLFENRQVLAGLGLFFALYAGMLAPRLPNSIIYFFDTTLGKFLFIFTIAFVASRNIPNSLNVAVIVSVMFLLAITTLNNTKLQEDFANMGREHFQVVEQFNSKNNNRNTVIPLIETLENEIAELITQE